VGKVTALTTAQIKVSFLMGLPQQDLPGLIKKQPSRQGRGDTKLQPGLRDKSLYIWQDAASLFPGLYFSFLVLTVINAFRCQSRT
jgi:hypothetical protein